MGLATCIWTCNSQIPKSPSRYNPLGLSTARLIISRTMADNAPVDVIRSTEESPPLSRSSTYGDQQRHAHGQDLEQQQDSIANQKPPQDVPPDGGYGWVCVACVFWINAHTWGINSVGRILSPRIARTKKLTVCRFFSAVIWSLSVLLPIK